MQTLECAVLEGLRSVAISVLIGLSASQIELKEDIAIKLHCMRCGRDFTTLSEKDKSKKFAIHHLQFDKMQCPYCGASNRGYKSGGKWNPFSQEFSEIREPNIIVHPQCRPHVSGSLFSPEGLTCHCSKECKSYFNCWTGNVDDGDYVVPLEKSIEERREEAKALMDKKKKEEKEQRFNQLRKLLGKVGLRYEFKNGTIYCRFGGTVWKLDSNDIEAIHSQTWNTSKTTVIKKTLDNKGIKSSLAKTLLDVELLRKKSRA